MQATRVRMGAIVRLIATPIRASRAEVDEWPSRIDFVSKHSALKKSFAPSKDGGYFLLDSSFRWNDVVCG